MQIIQDKVVSVPKSRITWTKVPVPFKQGNINKKATLHLPNCQKPKSDNKFIVKAMVPRNPFMDHESGKRYILSGVFLRLKKNLSWEIPCLCTRRSRKQHKVKGKS